MKNLFIIFTPYQMISAINSTSFLKDDENDFVLVHRNMERYRELCLEAINGCVFFASEMHDRTNNCPVAITHIIMLWRILKKKYYYKKMYRYMRYDQVFVPSDDITCRVFYHYIKKANKNIMLKLFDDGVGTYSGIIFRKKNKLSRLMYKILLDGKFYEMADEIYCYQPDLINANRGITLKKIYVQNDIKIFLKKMLNGKEEMYIGRKVIFLDQGITEFKEIEQCLKILLKYFAKDEILIKKHPRIENNVSYSDFTTIRDGIPSEAIMTVLDCSKCLLISYSSSGCITPYFTNNSLPNVIMLNKLCKREGVVIKDVNVSESNMKQVNELFEKINRQVGYEYICSPYTIAEYENKLENIKDEVEKIH